jgi:hypothetical protein
LLTLTVTLPLPVAPPAVRWMFPDHETDQSGPEPTPLAEPSAATCPVTG